MQFYYKFIHRDFNKSWNIFFQNFGVECYKLIIIFKTTLKFIQENNDNLQDGYQILFKITRFLWNISI